MSNNLTLQSAAPSTPSANKIIATEEGTGLEHYQKVKLIDSAAASTVGTGVAANPLQVSLANTAANATAVKVDGSAVTQPVSGTITANAGTGTMTVSGTVTANLGTIGGTATETSLAKLPISQGAALGTNSQVMAAGSVTTAAPTYTTGQVSPLSLDTTGALRVNITAGAGSGTSQADRSTFTDGTTSLTPVGGTFNETNTSPTEDQAAAVRITSKRAFHVNLRDNSGVELGIAATPVQVSLANTAVNATAVKVDGSAVTQPVSGTITANAGTGTFTTTLPSAVSLADNASATPSTPTVGVVNLVMNATAMDRMRSVVTAMDVVSTGIAAAGLVAQRDDVSPQTVTENNFSTLRLNAERHLLVQPAATTEQTSTALSSFVNGVTGVTNSAISVKASAGNVYGWYVNNPNATVSYLEIFNTASGSVVLGGGSPTLPVICLGIPANSAANAFIPQGVGLGTAISVAAVTLPGGNTAPGNNLFTTIIYK